MKAPKTYTVTSQAVEKLQKECDRIDVIKARIEKLQNELHEIQSENRWLNYLGPNSCDELTEDENIKLAELSQKINYCDR
ncbi:MAG: hypothetical protein LLG05_18675 [Porphyromonadaceae bacterium]|nr:hypothetical protein [Porphyromonadaceae bacterium]